MTVFDPIKFLFNFGKKIELRKTLANNSRNLMNRKKYANKVGIQN